MIPSETHQAGICSFLQSILANRLTNKSLPEISFANKKKKKKTHQIMRSLKIVTRGHGLATLGQMLKPLTLDFVQITRLPFLRLRQVCPGETGARARVENPTEKR